MAQRAPAQRNKGGRPPSAEKRAARLCKAICRNIANGNTLENSAKMAGISYNTLVRWRHLSVSFRDAVAKAEAEAEGLHVGNIVRAGVEGHWQASAWWLERRRHSEWRKPAERQEISGAEGGPIVLVRKEAG